MNILPWKSLHQLRDTVDIMDKTSCEVFDAKKRDLLLGDDAVLEQIAQGKDIMSILCGFIGVDAMKNMLIFDDV